MSPAPRRVSPWGWVALAGGVGLASSAVFSSLLQLPRALFLVPYSLLVAVLTAACFRDLGATWAGQLSRRWISGLLIGILAGGLLALSIQRQPPSPHPAGASLAGALAWYGVVYGIVDAVLLTIIPVLAVYGTRPADQLKQGATRFGWAGAAIAASLAVTALYHAGFAEFRGPALVAPLIGNLIITLSYLASGSVLAPILAHVIMHGAAVLHGMETAAQLPPHY